MHSSIKREILRVFNITNVKTLILVGILSDGIINNLAIWLTILAKMFTIRNSKKIPLIQDNYT